ncbi:MAG: hypothetical protein CMH16_24635 [Methylobacterium sp.]|nr:hypothetical protein [Methylobacterium sp.]
MKIVLAGQLDRVYSNALARASESDWREHVDPAWYEKDRLLFHRAGTLSALSDTVVTAPDWNQPDDEDEESRTAPRGKDPIFAPGMSLTKDLWASLHDDAAGLVEAVDFLSGYSKQSLATLDEIDTPDAWVDNDSPRSLRRASIGAPHAYLIDLLLQPFLAWQAGAVLVIAQADCHVLADVAKFLIDSARPRPFPIPDLRNVAAPDTTSATGRVINLGLQGLTDIEAQRRNPALQSYARQLHAILEAPELTDVGERLKAARPTGAQFTEMADDIAVVVQHAEILNNTGVQVAAHNKIFFRWARRKFSPGGLRTLILA